MAARLLRARGTACNACSACVCLRAVQNEASRPVSASLRWQLAAVSAAPRFPPKAGCDTRASTPSMLHSVPGGGRLLATGLEDAAPTLQDQYAPLILLSSCSVFCQNFHCGVGCGAVQTGCSDRGEEGSNPNARKGQIQTPKRVKCKRVSVSAVLFTGGLRGFHGFLGFDGFYGFYGLHGFLGFLAFYGFFGFLVSFSGLLWLACLPWLPWPLWFPCVPRFPWFPWFLWFPRLSWFVWLPWFPWCPWFSVACMVSLVSLASMVAMLSMVSIVSFVPFISMVSFVSMISTLAVAN